MSNQIQVPTIHQETLQQSVMNLDEPSFHEVDLRQYWHVCLKYRYLICILFVGCFLSSILYAFTATPRYQANSVIRIGSYEPILAATKIEDLLQQKSKESDYFETQLQQIKSLSLADRVVQLPLLRDFLTRHRPGFFASIFSIFSSSVDEKSDRPDSVSGYKNPILLLRKYLDQVDVSPVRRTSLVNINVSSSDPVFSATAANAHAQSYIDWVRGTRVDQQSRGLSFLTQQAEELRDRVADLERQQADYAEANSIIAVNKDENITAQKMSQLNKLLSDATAKHIETENAYEEAKKALSYNSSGYDDPTLEVTRSELAKLEGEQAQLAEKFHPSYPKMVQLASQISRLKKSIQDSRLQVVNGLKAKSLASAQEEKSLREELEQQKSLAFELSKRQVHYNALERELSSSRELLQNIVKQMKETSLSVEGNGSNVAIIDRAVVPTKPTYPRKVLVILVGALVGLGGGLGIAFLLNYLDNTVRTPDDITQMVQLPSLGVIPSFESSGSTPTGLKPLPFAPLKEGESEEPGRMDSIFSSEAPITLQKQQSQQAPVFLIDGRSLVSEAYRTIRTNILLSKAGQTPKRILITSAHPAEGKTTISVNLAAALASTGASVVLMDVDLRRPSVGKHFQIGSREKGVVDLLTGQASIDDVLVSTPVERVFVIPSGISPPNPTELIGSKEMGILLEQLAERFDYVVVDSAPLLPVTDSVLLSLQVDGVVLVVKGATTPARAVNDAKQKIRSVGARLMGVILNDVDIHGGDYYYYNRYYHSYYYGDQEKNNAA